MTPREFEELLSQQADRLVGGHLAGQTQRGPAAEFTGVERAGLNAEEQRSLGRLMQLARRVQSALVEVEPRPAFVADLKSRLLAQRRAEGHSAAGARRGMPWVWGLAGALGLTALGVLGYRAARAGWMSAAASRNARLALPKA